jgi:hypothetical protein
MINKKARLALAITGVSVLVALGLSAGIAGAAAAPGLGGSAANPSVSPHSGSSPVGSYTYFDSSGSDTSLVINSDNSLSLGGQAGSWTQTKKSITISCPGCFGEDDFVGVAVIGKTGLSSEAKPGNIYVPGYSGNTLTWYATKTGGVIPRANHVGTSSGDPAASSEAYPQAGNSPLGNYNWMASGGGTEDFTVSAGSVTSNGSTSWDSGCTGYWVSQKKTFGMDITGNCDGELWVFNGTIGKTSLSTSAKQGGYIESGSGGGTWWAPKV